MGQPTGAPRGEPNEYRMSNKEFRMMKFDELLKSHQSRHPGESRGPEVLVVPGFRLSPE
jgi:hypothetical protein